MLLLTYFSPTLVQSTPTMVNLQVQGCHPGYRLDEDSQTCVCDFSSGIIVQCDSFNRYFYARVSDSTLYSVYSEALVSI